MTMFGQALNGVGGSTVSEATEPAVAQRWWRRRGFRNWTVVAMVLGLLVGLQAVGSYHSYAPYDPTSTKPNGAKAFLMLMERAGAKVSRNNMPEGRTAVLLRDTLTAKETRAVEQWVEMGGTLIVGDPYSSFQLGGFNTNSLSAPVRLQPHCTTSFLSGVRNISPERDGNYSVFKSDLVADAQCFPAGRDGYYLQERSIGHGKLIELGGSHIFTNDRLDKVDNSVLLVNILRPSANNSITILETRDPTSTEGPTSNPEIDSLLPPYVQDAMVLLFIGALLWICWHARRLGRPIEEEPLVRIPASQLIVANGNLLELAQQSTAAAAILRDDFRNGVVDRFGVRTDAPNDVFVELVSSRTGIPEQRLRAVFEVETVATPESLVVYAQRVEQLQQEVNHVR